MWLEALVSKSILGQHRRVGDRFEAPLNATMALMGSGVCRKVDGPHPASKPATAKRAAATKTPEPEDDLSEADEALAILVGRALADGRMPTLVKALTAVGLNPSDYSNNTKREAALHAWLEA